MTIQNSAVTPNQLKEPSNYLEGGRKTYWEDIARDQAQPLITIITSTYNAVSDLPWTIESIRKINYPNIQWIIADGGSTDGTIDLLRLNHEIIDLWFSAPDKGIYDAWNKALVHVKGEWILFIGAGDELASPDVFSKMAPYLSHAYPRHDLVYGRLQLINETTREVMEDIGTPWDEIKGKWECFRPKLPIHPAIFHHHKITKHNGFDSKYKIAGDSKLLIICIKQKDPLYVPILIDKMLSGGVSASIENNFRTTKEVREISAELGIAPPLTHLLMEHTKVFMKRLLVKFMPEKKLYFVADLYRKVLRKPKKWTI